MKKVLFTTFLFFAFFILKAQDPKGQTVIGFIAPTDSLDDYYTHDDYFGKTATKIVKTITQRDDLPISRRQVGMKVYVQDFSTWYRLEDCLDNNCWILDRIDTLFNGTHSTGKITVQPKVDGATFLYDGYNYQGYQRFGVTKNGLLIAGRRMPLAIGVDGLAFIGDRNEMLATDGIAIGKDLIVNGDTAAAFGYNLESNKYNALLIGRGANRSNRVKSRWMRSVNFGAFQTIPQIELTKDTIRLNSTVLWWNGAPIGGSYSFPYTQTLTSNINWTSGNNSMFYQMGSAPYYSTWLLHKNYMRVSSNGDWRSGFLGVYPDRIDISMTSLTGNSDLRIDTTGISYLSHKTSQNPLWIPDKNYVDSLVSANGGGAETDPVFNASPAKNITSGNISTWNSLVSFPGFGTSGSTAAYGNHNHTGVYLTPNGDGSGLTGITKSQIGLPNADNTSDANKPISTATQTALNAKEPTIPTGTATDYIAGDKTIKSFPIKYLRVTIPNASLTTTSSTQLVPLFIAYSTIIGAYISFSESVSAGSGFTANIKIGNSIGSPLVNLTNITSVGPVAYRFVSPTTTDYVGSNDALYFNVTASGITSNTVTATVTVIYFDSSNYY